MTAQYGYLPAPGMRRLGKAVQQHDRRTIARKRVMQLDTVDGTTMARNSSMHRSVPVCSCIKTVPGARIALPIDARTRTFRVLHGPWRCFYSGPQRRAE